MSELHPAFPDDITTEADIIKELDRAYLEGYADETVGTVQYGSGHYIFHEVDGRYFVLHTDSQGFKLGFELKKSEWEDAKREAIDEYAEMDSDLD